MRELAALLFFGSKQSPIRLCLNTFDREDLWHAVFGGYSTTLRSHLPEWNTYISKKSGSVVAAPLGPLGRPGLCPLLWSWAPYIRLPATVRRGDERLQAVLAILRQAHKRPFYLITR
jgi:hypothetical protein